MAKKFVRGISTVFESKDKNEYKDSIVFLEDTKQIWSNDIYYGGSSDINSVLIPITYQDLKDLRDSHQLIPGMQYRITNYFTTTVTNGTRSAFNQFDIIVTADSNNTLNEKARAIQHTIDLIEVKDEDGLPYVYMRYPKFDRQTQYAWVYIGCDDYIENIGEYDILIEDLGDIIYTDSPHPEVNANEYKYIMRGDIAVSISAIGSILQSNYFSNSNLSTWELKYSLDNDSTRFIWANEGEYGYIEYVPIIYSLNEDTERYTLSSINIALPYYTNNLMCLMCKLVNEEDSLVDYYYYTGRFIYDEVTYDMWSKEETSQEIGSVLMRKSILTPIITNNGEFDWKKIRIPRIELWAEECSEGMDVCPDISAYVQNFNETGLPALFKQSEYAYHSDIDQSTVYLFSTSIEQEDGTILDKWDEYSEDGQGGNNWSLTGNYILTQHIVEYYTIQESLLYKNEFLNSGRGIIYYMKDEYGNECPYDFKNIQYINYIQYNNSITSVADASTKFKTYTVKNVENYPSEATNTILELQEYDYSYTFSDGDYNDLSLDGSSCNNNIIEPYKSSSNGWIPLYQLPIIVINSPLCHHNKFESCCGRITLNSDTNINHNIFSQRCINCVISNKNGFYDNQLVSLQGSIIICGATWYNKYSGKNVITYSTGDTKGNIFNSSTTHSIKIATTSLQNNIFDPVSIQINIYNGGYFFANTFYQYANAITIDGFNWIQSLNVYGNNFNIIGNSSYKLYNTTITAENFNGESLNIINTSDNHSTTYSRDSALLFNQNSENSNLSINQEELIFGSTIDGDSGPVGLTMGIGASGIYYDMTDEYGDVNSFSITHSGTTGCTLEGVSRIINSNTLSIGILSANIGLNSGGVGVSGNHFKFNETNVILSVNGRVVLNNEILPLANSGSIGTVGAVFTTSEVTSDEGYTPCPIINGIVYYKEGSGGSGGGSVNVDALKTEIIYNANELDLNNVIVKQDDVTIIDKDGNLSEATSERFGGIKLGYEPNGRNYPVKLDNGRAFVNVDLEISDTKTTVGVGSNNGALENGRLIFTLANTSGNNTSYLIPNVTYYQGFNETNPGFFFGTGEDKTIDIDHYGNYNLYGTLYASELTCDDLNVTDLTVNGESLSNIINNIELKLATDTDLGGIKIGYNTDNTNKNYPVQLDNGQAYVHVPWTDNNNKVKTSTSPGSNYYLCGSTSSESSDGESLVKKNNVYVGYLNSAIYATGGFYETSDERLKNFTERIPVDLDKLSKLKKNYFTWKDSENTEQQLGVSAQEIQSIYPEIVSEQENGVLTVAYDKLSVIALAAIDELHKKNKELEQRLIELENKLN